jgi:hypothetical protein
VAKHQQALERLNIPVAMAVWPIKAVVAAAVRLVQMGMAQMAVTARAAHFLVRAVAVTAGDM